MAPRELMLHVAVVLVVCAARATAKAKAPSLVELPKAPPTLQGAVPRATAEAKAPPSVARATAKAKAPSALQGAVPQEAALVQVAVRHEDTGPRRSVLLAHRRQGRGACRSGRHCRRAKRARRVHARARPHGARKRRGARPTRAAKGAKALALTASHGHQGSDSSGHVLQDPVQGHFEKERLKAPPAVPLPAQQAAEMAQEKSLNAQEDSAHLADQVVAALPALRYQPLWNIVNPNALHSGSVVDTPLEDLEDELTTEGKKLAQAYPKLRIRDLPVFVDLPKPIPESFSWAQPLADSLVSLLGSSKVEQQLLKAMPFHVRTTPAQALRLEDLALLGDRQRWLNRKEAAVWWRQQAREENFKHVDVDKKRSIRALREKSAVVQRHVEEMYNEYHQEDAHTEKLRQRTKEDADLSAKQQSLLDAQVTKEKQLDGISKELRASGGDQERAFRELRGQELQLRRVIALKDKAEGVLRQQMRAVRKEISKEEQAMLTREERAEDVMRTLEWKTKKAKDLKSTLDTEAKGLEAAVQAETSDKKHLEQEAADLATENHELQKKDKDLEQVESAQESQRQGLEREVKGAREERERLQHEVDSLEGDTLGIGAVAGTGPGSDPQVDTALLSASDDDDDDQDAEEQGGEPPGTRDGEEAAASASQGAAALRGHAAVGATPPAARSPKEHEAVRVEVVD